MHGNTTTKRNISTQRRFNAIEIYAATLGLTIQRIPKRLIVFQILDLVILM
jgi:hypothetical protein